MTDVINNIVLNESKFIELEGGMALINVNEIVCTRASITEKGFDIILKNGMEFHCANPDKYCLLKQLITYL